MLRQMKKVMQQKISGDNVYTRGMALLEQRGRLAKAYLQDRAAISERMSMIAFTVLASTWFAAYGVVLVTGAGVASFLPGLVGAALLIGGAAGGYAIFKKGHAKMADAAKTFHENDRQLVVAVRSATKEMRSTAPRDLRVSFAQARRDAITQRRHTIGLPTSRPTTPAATV